MKTINFTKKTTLLLAFIIGSAGFMFGQVEVEYNSNTSEAHLEMFETNQNDFTRIFLGNTNGSNQFRINSRFFEGGADKNLFNINFYDGTTTTNFMRFDADAFEILFKQTTLINSDSSNGTPILNLQESDDNDFSRLYFTNQNNTTDRWSIATFLSSTDSDGSFGIYKNGVYRLRYDDETSLFEVVGDLDVSSSAEITTDLTVGNSIVAEDIILDEFVRIKPTVTPPTCSLGGANNGRVSFSSVLNKLRVCVNGSWENLN